MTWGKGEESASSHSKLAESKINKQVHSACAWPQDPDEWMKNQHAARTWPGWKSQQAQCSERLRHHCRNTSTINSPVQDTPRYIDNRRALSPQREDRKLEEPAFKIEDKDRNPVISYQQGFWLQYLKQFKIRMKLWVLRHSTTLCDVEMLQVQAEAIFGRDKLICQNDHRVKFK